MRKKRKKNDNGNAEISLLIAALCSVTGQELKAT